MKEGKTNRERERVTLMWSLSDVSLNIVKVTVASSSPQTRVEMNS